MSAHINKCNKLLYLLSLFLRIFGILQEKRERENEKEAKFFKANAPFERFMVLTYYLLGEIDLERERTGLRIGERLRLRLKGDLLGGLRARLGGEL